MNVTVARVDNRHGTDVYVGATEADALRKVAEYCRDNWEELGFNGVPPADDVKAITKYFAKAGDTTGESYELDIVHVAGTGKFKVVCRLYGGETEDACHEENEDGTRKLVLFDTYEEAQKDIKEYRADRKEAGMDDDTSMEIVEVWE